MGSGLILAGIGKGIADAGTTYGNMMFREAEADMAEQRALQRAEALERLKGQLEEETARQDADVYGRVQTRASEIAAARKAAQQPPADASTAAAPTAPANARPQPAPQGKVKATAQAAKPAASAAPQPAADNDQASLIRQEMQGYDDMITAGREVGANSRVMKSLQEAKKARLDEIRVEIADKKADRQYDATIAAITERGRQFDETKPIRQQQADAATARANRPASSGGGRSGSGDRPATTADIQRQINAARDDIALALGSSRNDVNASIASIQKRAAAGDARAVKKLNEIQPYLNSLRDANDRMQQFKRTPPTESGKGGDNAGPARKGVWDPAAGRIVWK